MSWCTFFQQNEICLTEIKAIIIRSVIKAIKNLLSDRNAKKNPPPRICQAIWSWKHIDDDAPDGNLLHFCLAIYFLLTKCASTHSELKETWKRDQLKKGWSACLPAFLAPSHLFLKQQGHLRKRGLLGQNPWDLSDGARPWFVSRCTF